MPDRYTPAQLAAFRADYERDGAVVVPGLMEAHWVETIKGIVTHVRTHVDDLAKIGPTVECGRGRGRITLRWLWRDMPQMRAFFETSDVYRYVAAVIGAQRVQYWYDLTFLHEPGTEGEGSGWHHDISAFPFKGEQIPSLWIALVDIDEEMSPLQSFRGSHRWPGLIAPPYRPTRPLMNEPVPPEYIDEPDYKALIASGKADVQTWLVKAGDAVILHPNTIHGAPPNRTKDKTRIGFSSRWIGDDVTWRPDCYSMPIPGVDYTKAPLGQRPDGPFFPYAGEKA
jgi:ectoine hydroxylase-related dioxygenase (phytanoyl-CoA dioxygenase family)